MANVLTREAAWRFFHENWDKMLEKYPINSIPRMIEGITHLTTEKMEAEVRQFFDKHPVKGGAKAVAQNLEKLNVAVKMKKRESANFAKLFS
jgi:hypothetical protein